MTSLYRKAAIDAQSATPVGHIVLISPPTYRFLSLVALCCAGLVVLFFIFGSYTKHSTVVGQLMPESGLIRVYSPRPGMVLERPIREGQKVAAGDLLFVVGEAPVVGGDDFRERLGLSALIEADAAPMLFSKAAETQAQLRILDDQIETQRQRIRLTRETLDAYGGLKARQYIPAGQIRQKEEVLLDQKAILQRLLRERTALTHQLGDQFAPITAPRAGVVTALNAEVGQTIQGQRPLVSIVPENTALYAHLYAPSRSIGFIRAGDAVRLRFQAFPYQKFGHADGVVSWISRAAIDPSDIATPATALQSREPLYEIHVRLETQTMNAYGESHPLQTGMNVEAEILRERRRLYEWVLDPLFTLSGATISGLALSGQGTADA